MKCNFRIQKHLKEKANCQMLAQHHTNTWYTDSLCKQYFEELNDQFEKQVLHKKTNAVLSYCKKVLVISVFET